MDPQTNDSNTPAKFDLSQYKYINPSRNFLSEAVLHNIFKSASPKIYFKLIQCSKYFLANEFPTIRHFKDIYYHGYFQKYITENDETMSEVIGEKLWLCAQDYRWVDRKNRTSLSRFLERVYRCDLASLNIWYQDFTYDELRILMEAGTIKLLALQRSKVTHSNGSTVDIEDILVMIPNVFKVFYDSHNPYTFTSGKVAALPMFNNLKRMYINDLTKKFNYIAYSEFLKKTKFPHSTLRFKSKISKDFISHFEAAIKSITSYTFKINHVHRWILITRKD